MRFFGTGNFLNFFFTFFLIFTTSNVKAEVPAKKYYKYLVPTWVANREALMAPKYASPVCGLSGTAHYTNPDGSSSVHSFENNIPRYSDETTLERGCVGVWKVVVTQSDGFVHAPVYTNYDGADAYYYCEENPSITWGAPFMCPDPAPPLDPKNTPDTSPCDGTNESISFNAGNEVIREVDHTSLGFGALSFNRIYNSTSAVYPSNQGAKWRNGLNRSIQHLSNYGVALAYRSGGKVYTFSLGSNLWLPDADITDKLTELKNVEGVRTGWTYKAGGKDEVETYDANGKLLSIKDRAGSAQTMEYTCGSNGCITVPGNPPPVENLLIKVTDQLGRSLNYSYDNLNRIKTMTNPAGGSYTYTYSTDGNNNLASVTYPDNKTKTYLYGEATNVSTTPNAGVSYANALTGIIDENNNRYATYRYDAAGRAYDEEIAPDLGVSLGQQLEHNNLVYNVDANGNPTNTVVTDARGSARTYNFTTILGVVKSTGQSQPGGSGCAASASALTYDANGNVASRTDFAGHQTTYVYDLSRNLETSRTEGLTTAGAVTPATRTITTTWHTTWRLPLVTTTHTGGASATGVPTGAALHKVTNVYDTKGNITSITENDPVRALNRVTTITYTYSTAVPGLVLTKV
ncbi:MAG: hypothetical protein CTY14_08820, partial [Methylotenera sp.]